MQCFYSIKFSHGLVSKAQGSTEVWDLCISSCYQGVVFILEWQQKCYFTSLTLNDRGLSLCLLKKGFQYQLEGYERFSELCFPQLSNYLCLPSVFSSENHRLLFKSLELSMHWNISSHSNLQFRNCNNWMTRTSSSRWNKKGMSKEARKTTLVKKEKFTQKIFSNKSSVLWFYSYA